jgi:hypothetical protein
VVQEEVHGNHHPDRNLSGELALPRGEGVRLLQDRVEERWREDAAQRMELQVGGEVARGIELA